MARPQKNGLDYYPQDTTSDRKWKLFKAKYGLEGIGLLTELFKVIYAEGFFYLWDDEAQLLFAAENGLSEDKMKTMIDYAMDKGIFDRNIYEKYELLTSKGIQKRFFEACWKRTTVNVFPEIMLIEPKKPEWSKATIEEKELSEYLIEDNSENSFQFESETQVLESETNVLESETQVLDSRNTQSKVKKSKVKEINTRESPPAESAEPPLEKLPEKQLQKTEPDVPVKNKASPKELSRLKDDLAQYYQEQFVSQFPHEAWDSYAKERKQLTTIAGKTRNIIDKTPYDDEQQVAREIFKTYLDMKRYGKTDYWRDAPVTPSGLSTRWSKVWDRLAQDYAESKSEVDFSEVHF